MWFVAPGVMLAVWGAYLLAERPVHAKQAAAAAVVPTVEVRSGTVERTLRVPGQTSARNYASIIVARFRGQPSLSRNLILTKLTPGGTHVKTGDVVAEVDPEDMLNAIDDLKASLDQAQLDLGKLKAQQTLDWQNLTQTVQAAKAAWESAEWDDKATEVKTPIDQELLRLSVEQADAQYKQQQKSLPLERVSQEAQFQMSQLALQREQLVYKWSLDDLASLTFRAPMDGLVVLQTVERSGGTDAQYAVGDAVNPGREFMKIVDTSSMQVEAVANQAEARQIHVGAPARVTLDAFPSLQFTGTVYSVGAIARQGFFENYYVRTVPVVVRIQGSSSRLLPDMSAAADIVLGGAENKPVIPIEALQSENGRYFVYVRVGPQFEKRYVQVGPESATRAAILSGLNPGDRVALAKPPVGT